MAQPNTHHLGPNTSPRPFAGEKIEVTAAPSSEVSIEVRRGLAGKVRGFFDRDSLAAAGVLTATEAHHAQDLARGINAEDTVTALEVERAQALIDNTDGEIGRWD